MNSRHKIVRYCILLMALLAMTACSSPSPRSDDCGDRPCWVLKAPADGVVVSMAEHVDPSKTREVLFNKALVELAAASEGFNVSQDSIVKKQVTSVNGQTSESAQVVNLANVNSGGGELRVRAKIKAQWQDQRTRKLYLWVIATD